jgi:WD40 repeat protein
VHYTAVSSDGKTLLIADWDYATLDVIDLSQFKVIKKVNLVPALKEGAYSLGSIVVVGTNAYVTSTSTDFSHPAVAVVDLSTFKVKAVPIPAGYVDESGFLTPNAAATPDGKYVVMVETYNSDSSFHVLCISTATNAVVQNYSIATDPYGILISPSGSTQYAYILGAGNFLFSATIFNLQTGQLLPQTEVELDNYFDWPTTAAINPEGTRLVIGGEELSQEPNPNLVVVNTSTMLTKPSGAVVGHATIAGGVRPYGTAIASVVSTPPSTAPKVTSVTPSTVNNAKANVIQLAGTNFAAGAQVRFGTMAPLTATVLDQGHLKVTLPKNAPAQSAMDVIVTNPNLSGPLANQYQSGLLAGKFMIVAAPAFQPKYGFATFAFADWTVAVYDSGTQQMINVPTSLVPFSVGFNTDGAEIYSLSPGIRGLSSSNQLLLDYNPATDVVQAQVPLGFPAFSEVILASMTASSVNPATGTPVVYVPVVTGYPSDLAVEMVDTKSGSSTFNQIINTTYAGLNASLMLGGVAATPDGKYVYVNYVDASSATYAYAVFDVVHNSVTEYDATALGVSALSDEVYVTPDGQSLLLNASDGSLAVLDISGTNATHPTLVATIRGSRTYVSSWQVLGSQLFVLAEPNTVIVFNFDRADNNFSEIASYKVSQGAATSLAVSPDGGLIYLPIIDSDMIAVLDANRLVGHKQPIVTAIGTPRAPLYVVVDPVANSGR